MVNKKKYVNIYYIVSFGVLFAIFFGLFSNSYAMTESEVDYFISETVDFLNEKNTSYAQNLENYYNIYKNDIYNICADYSSLIFRFIGNNYWLYLMNTDYIIYKGTSYINLRDRNSTYLGTHFPFVFNTNTVGPVGNNSSGSFFAFNENTDYLTTSNPLYASRSSEDIYENSSYMYIPINNIITNSIILEASSGRKFTFNDFNQLRVYISGEWSIDDFTFYVQRYIDNQWENFTEPWDYTRIVGYTDPYYIRWNNLNYFPAGTYRYCADYGSLGTDLYYSNSFEITSSSVINPIVGNNGDVSGSVDTGNTVDDIKDYFGSPADFTDALSQEDIDNALDLDFVSNPYENFILSFFNGLVSSFTDDASDLTFRVHTWGELRTVKVADVTPNYNSDLRVFLTIFSTIVWCFVIVKWCSKIIDGITHMSLQDSIDLIDAHYSDLF